MSKIAVGAGHPTPGVYRPQAEMREPLSETEGEVALPPGLLVEWAVAKPLGASPTPGAARKTPSNAPGRTQLGSLAPAPSAADPSRNSVVPLVLSSSGETERVGPFEVVGVLGRGGMGVVY